MTDQTTPTTVSTLVDHVVVTNTVVEQLEAHTIRLHHGDGEYSSVPRYVADEIGQAVLALVPDDITPEQAALLDAVRDVALSNDAMAGEYAGKQLVRLAAAAFGYPVPEPVQRAGGLVDVVLGKPVNTLRVEGGTLDPKRVHVGDVTRTYPGRVVISPEKAVELGLRKAPEVPEPWPFKPGTVVRDEDGAEVEWLDAAPVGTVVRVAGGYQWTRQDDCWDNAGRLAASLAIAQQAPVTVVSVPEQEADRG